MIGPYKRILVTGGAGFIGSHLCESLRMDGCEIVVIDDLSMGLRDNVPDIATFIEGDVRDFDTVRSALDGVDAVIHLAARVSVRSSVEQFHDDASANVMGTLNLLRACAGGSVRRFVYASSMAVYADSPEPTPLTEDYTTQPLSPYGIGKLASEMYTMNICKQIGIEPVVLRFFNTYGPGQTYTPYVGVITIFVRRLLNGEPPIIFGDGEQSRDFISVDDIVTACSLALEADCAGEIYNIGSGLPVTVNQLADSLCEMINPELKPIHKDAQPGELRNCIADVSKARQKMGYAPLGMVEDMLEEIIEHYKATATSQTPQA
jgi:UDP-glucose 4-epimerase